MNQNMNNTGYERKGEQTLFGKNSNTLQQRKKRKALKLTGIIFAGFAALLILAFVSITVIYPAILRSANRINTPNGIDSMEVVEIGGIQQMLYFRGQNVENPVILVLHGGPGRADMAILHNYQFELEEHFTFVRWDQRNAGKTFFLSDPHEVLETMTFELVLNDAYEVTQYIREKLGQEQIIILGHSWGSVLGTALVQNYPQYFSAFISVGQAVSHIENEQLNLETVLEAARANGDSRSIAAVEALSRPQGSFEEYSEDWISHITGVNALMARDGYESNFLQMAWLTLHSPFYTLREKMHSFTVNIFY